MPTARCGKDLWVSRGRADLEAEIQGLSQRHSPLPRSGGGTLGVVAVSQPPRPGMLGDSRERIPADCEHSEKEV